MYYFSRYPLLLSIDNSVFMYKLKVVHNKQIKELDSQKIKKKKREKKTPRPVSRGCCAFVDTEVGHC